MKNLDHILYVLAALIAVLGAIVALTLLGHPTPKLVDGVLLLIGAIAGLAKTTS